MLVNNEQEEDKYVISPDFWLDYTVMRVISICSRRDDRVLKEGLCNYERQFLRGRYFSFNIFIMNLLNLRIFFNDCSLLNRGRGEELIFLHN